MLQLEPILHTDVGAHYTDQRLFLEEMPKPGDYLKLDFFSGTELEELKVTEVVADLCRVYLERELLGI